MRYGVLGPLQVSGDERLIEIAGRKQRALLAMLLLHANEVVSTDRLIDALWGEVPPGSAGNGLQVYVSHLRKLLGRERLRTQPPGYVLVVAEGELDLDGFRRLAAAGRFHDALSLWRGRPLADFAFERFAQAEIARLEEERLVCLEERIEADLGVGRHAGLVGELDALVGEHPLRERLRGQLMLALYRSERQAEALEAYQAARSALVEGLGIEPSRQLRELHQAILRQDRALELSRGELPGTKLASDEARSSYVGRERELAMLAAGLDDALAGRGRLFLMSGEPGIGKSRLADELVARARARGAEVLFGRCWEAGGAPAYWPWAQALRVHIRETERQVLGEEAGSGAAELAHLLPELREILPGLPERDSPDSEGARFRLFDATVEFLRRASARRALVLVLDDLHAADTPSLLLLQFLARELGSSRLLVLGAFRDVDPVPNPALGAMLGAVTREPVTRRLPLAGLSAPDVARYVEQSASEIASPELIAALYEETEGNPLFLGETVRLLLLEGIQPGPGGARRAIPPSIRDVIERRLAHLSEECNHLLVRASVLGRDFALDTLARVAGSANEEALLETLDEAMAARIIADMPGSTDRLRFTHVLIRDTLYEGLTSARRVLLHRQSGEALEALYGHEPGPHLAELAHHAIAGGDLERGSRYARAAGDRALTLSAYEEAVRLYETALDRLELEGVSKEWARCTLLLARGEAETRAGDTPSAQETFLAAAAIARQLGLTTELARAAAGYGGRIVWARAGDDYRLVPLLEEALAALAGEDAELRARLLARLAGALRDEHSRDRRDALSREAVELARRHGSAAVLSYALVGRAHAIVAPDTVLECLALGTELREVALQSGDREQVVAAHMLRNLAHLLVGDVAEGQIELAAATSVAVALRQPAQLWQVRACEAQLALAAGRLDEADGLITQAFELGERALPEVAIPIYLLQRYTLCDFRAHLEEIEHEIRDLVVTYPARPVFRCVLAHLLGRLGRLSEAQLALNDLAGADFSALPFDQEWLYGTSLLAETFVLLGDAGACSLLYELLLPWAAFNAVDVAEGFRGSVARYLGLLATATGRLDDAQRHFEDALARNQQMLARPWLAYTQSDYAQMLLTRDLAGDAERAENLLERALATALELGIQTLPGAS
jgi:DNA-binding SARP family transcriptional activator/tetratricopeptide (TPR) repeat protein